jgi:hypothetical protein
VLLQAPREVSGDPYIPLPCAKAVEDIEGHWQGEDWG